MLRERVKWWLFPGLNLNARLRYRTLPRYFGKPEGDRQRRVLDAGCGNGMLSYRSCLLGNRVLGISIKQGEVDRNRRMFNRYHGIPEDRLAFTVHNLYEVESLGTQFDEIICSEVLEHIRSDDALCRSFWNILKPGGTLHLCCPNADHPANANGPLDPHETGGHVRPGYTAQTYATLLEPIGFRLSEVVGVGGSVREACNSRITAVQNSLGLLPGAVCFACLWPLVWLDRRVPRVPYSVYVRATKVGGVPGEAEGDAPPG